jgi:predicted TPR repeat methyltransferase
MKWLRAGHHLAKGDRARDNRDWVAAARSYERFLHRKPGNAAIWVQLGHMHKECGNYASAANAYQNALNLTPQDADIHLQIGHLNKLTGNMRLALLAFRRALALDPRLDVARREARHLGDEALYLSEAEELTHLKRQVRDVAGRLLIVEQALTELAAAQNHQ